MNITSILITMLLEERQILFIAVSKDGSTNRMGDGSANCTDNDMFIGHSDNNGFDELVKDIDDEFIAFSGAVYDIPNKVGREAKLRVAYMGEGIDNGFEIIYGEKSQGPPKQIVDFVLKAIKFTDPWHKEQKRMTQQANSNKDKKWWQFWA
jgi:hypothetical protein